MKITTGLTPNVEKWAIRPDMPTISVGGVRLAVPRSTGSESAVWSLTFAPELDTLKLPRGVTQSIVLLASEPKVERRAFTFHLLDELAEYHARETDAAFAHYGAPADAVVEDERMPWGRVTKRRVFWWEVTA